MHVTTVSSKHQVTLSKPLREKLGIRPGDKLLVEIKGHSLVLTATALIPRDQLYFWSERWQEGEREAEDDIRARRLSRSFAPTEAGTLVRSLWRDGKAGRRVPRRVVRAVGERAVGVEADARQRAHTHAIVAPSAHVGTEDRASVMGPTLGISS